MSGDLTITVEGGRRDWSAALVTTEPIGAATRNAAGPVDVDFGGGTRGQAFVSFEDRAGIGGSMTRIRITGTGELDREP